MQDLGQTYVYPEWITSNINISKPWLEGDYASLGWQEFGESKLTTKISWG